MGHPKLYAPKNRGHPKIATGQVSMFREDSAWMCIPVSICVCVLVNDFKAITHTWLVVLTILKNISQWEGLSHILWKIKNVFCSGRNDSELDCRSDGRPLRL